MPKIEGVGVRKQGKKVFCTNGLQDFIEITFCKLTEAMRAGRRRPRDWQHLECFSLALLLVLRCLITRKYVS